MLATVKFNLRGGTGILEKRGPKTATKGIYQVFTDWFVFTLDEKKKSGILTQKAFAEKYGISEQTLSLWANSRKFKADADIAHINKLNEEGADAWEGVMKRIKKYGFGYEMELYLAYVKGWDRKKVIEFANELRLSDGDLRLLVENLPDARKQFFYDTLTDLIAEATEADELTRD